MNEQEQLDQIMGFDPQNLNVFTQPTESGYVNEKVYKTNPIRYSKSDDGHYHSRVRLLYNPFNIKESVVKRCFYAMNDANGFFITESSLLTPGGNKKCPIFNAWKKLHFSGDPEQDNFAKEVFDKKEEQYVLIQVIEDNNNPDLVGKFLGWKLPKPVYEKLEAKMNPSAESKKNPVAIMDYLFGPILEIDVTPGPDDPKNPQRKQREISYSLCEFESDPFPIINIDGQHLFTDEEIELVENYNAAKNASLKAKTEKAKNDKINEMKAMADGIRALYTKALAFMKENAFDIVDEFGFHEWDEATTARVNNWLEAVLQMRNPKSTLITETSFHDSETDDIESTKVDDIGSVDDDDLPF